MIFLAMAVLCSWYIIVHDTLFVMVAGLIVGCAVITQLIFTK